MSSSGAAGILLGRPRVHFRLTDSTSERARELAGRGAPHGTLVTANEQTAGRGRQGRAWIAPAGSSVLMSLVLRDRLGSLLPLVAPVAVCEGCERAASVSCRIKWPNDIWIEGRKVAGILLEGRPAEGWAVLGIGINVRARPEELPAELREAATSLAAETKAEHSVDDVLAEVLRALELGLARPDTETLERWRSRDALRASPVVWQHGEGIARGITAAGALVVQVADETVELDAGEVHLRRPTRAD